ncbi:MAG TPA: nitroreductase family protein [bacterium]|nr:nitroreductase family protein [bacterium]
MSDRTAEYDILIDLLRDRMSFRKLKPDPIPDEFVEKILEAGRWAMSGANSQPWEYIVVKDASTKAKLWEAFQESNRDFLFWMEQQRIEELRHPSYQRKGNAEEQWVSLRKEEGWSKAPVLIVVLGDGRKQWGTVQGAHTMGRGETHLTDSLANTSFAIHMAASALGLGAQWSTVHIQEPMKRILNVPDLLMLYLIIPIGYPAVEKRPGVRTDLAKLVHYETYDMNRYLTNQEAFKYLRDLRKETVPKFRSSGFPDIKSKLETD